MSLVEVQRGLAADSGTARSVALSADGRHAYIARDGAIGVFARDDTRGTLTSLGAVEGAFESLALAADDRHLYVAGSDGLSVFERNAVSGEINFVESHQVQGFPVVSPGGEQVYVGNDAGVSVFQRAVADGRLSAPATSPVSLYADHAARFSPDGRHLYASGSPFGGSSVLPIFSRNPDSGALTFLDQIEGLFPSSFANPQSIEVTPDGAFVYATSDSDLILTILARDPLNGGLSIVDTLQEAGGELGATIEIAVSHDGKHLYSVSFLDEAVVVSARDPETGRFDGHRRRARRRRWRVRPLRTVSRGREPG